MARVYMITEEEMKALLNRLELAKLREAGHFRGGDERVTMDDMHRTFHMQVTRWADEVGFTETYRR